jgi:hypothetical protein
MIIRELTDSDQRRAQKETRLRDATKGGILSSLSRLMAKKKQAQQSLEEAEQEEAQLVAKQREYNSLISERRDLEIRLKQAENHGDVLNNDITVWRQNLLDRLFAFTAHELDQSAYFVGQIALARERLDLLPLAVKNLKARLAEVVTEIKAIEAA